MMRSRWLLATLLALSLIAAACGGGEPPSADSKAGSQADAGRLAGKTGDGSSGTSEETDAAAGGEAAGGEDASGDGVTAGSSETGGSGGSPGGAAGAESATPLAEGTYEYDTDGQVVLSGGPPRDLPATTTLTGQKPNGVAQRRVRDLRDAEGNGTVTETDLEFRPDGVYITRVKVTVSFPGGVTDVRELKTEKPELIAPTGGGPGFATSFVMTGSGTTAEVSIRVLRAETISIGGRSVEAQVAETKIVFSGALRGHQTSTCWFWPKHIVAVKEVVSADIQNGPIRAQTEYEATLRSLTP